MGKQVNKNIGMIQCPICRGLCAVRKNRASKFYFDCPKDGRITPNLPAGQTWVLDNATIWGETGTPPAHAPEWITGNMRWRDSLVAAAQNKPAPVITGNSENLPPPPPKKEQPQKPDPAPVKQGFGFLGF